MASSRKLRVQLHRAKRKMEIKRKRQIELKLALEKKMKGKNFRKEIKEALGFDKIKIKSKKPDGEWIPGFRYGDLF